jgi:hypothetical protein
MDFIGSIFGRLFGLLPVCTSSSLFVRACNCTAIILRTLMDYPGRCARLGDAEGSSARERHDSKVNAPGSRVCELAFVSIVCMCVYMCVSLCTHTHTYLHIMYLHR